MPFYWSEIWGQAHIGCFDIDELIVFQEPKEGVRTKGTKSIVTTLLRFDDELLKYILDWVDFLVKDKFYDKTQPLFPRTKLDHVSDKNACFVGKGLEPVFWKSEGPILSIFKKRTKTAGLPYYSPHKFRHAAIAESRKYCRTEEQRKAISQNVGHKHVGTTFAYGNMDASKVNEVVSRMRLRATDNKVELLKNYTDDELLDELKSRR